LEENIRSSIQEFHLQQERIVSADLKYYWLSYFRLQRLTLFDFERKVHLSDSYFNVILLNQ